MHEHVDMCGVLLWWEQDDKRWRGIVYGSGCVCVGVYWYRRCCNICCMVQAQLLQQIKRVREVPHRMHGHGMML